MHQAIQSPVYVCLLLINFVGVSVVAALPLREPPEEKKDKPEKESNADEEWRKEVEKVVSGIELEKLVDENWSMVKRIEKPILYYSEPTENKDRGSVWAWGEKGRPVALVKLCHFVGVRSRWQITITNTSGGKL